MNLNETPERIIWPATHYLYVEKRGPFHQTAPQAWQELHAHLPALTSNTALGSYFSQYKIEPEMIYRAGVGLRHKPGALPAGLSHALFPGGPYLRFVLTGSYMNLPAACARVFEIVAAGAVPIRDDFYLEHYLTDPRTTPEEELATEILIPVA